MATKLKKGICVAGLLLFLGLMWLMAADGFPFFEDTPGEAALRRKKEVPLERRDNLVAMILESFNPYVWDVKKVSWGTEELVSRMWEQLEQCREGDVGRPTWWRDTWEIVLVMWRRSEKKSDFPHPATGYIQLFPEAQGSLKGYAVMALGWWQYTYLVTEKGIYQIYSTAGTRSWRESMEELLQSVPQWRMGEEEARQYVHDFKADRNAFYGPFLDIDRLSVWYDGMNFLFTEHKLLEAPKDMVAKNGMSLWFWDAEYQEQELRISPIEMPVFAGYEEWRKYLLALHPDMTGCYFRTREVGQYCADPFIMLETKEAQWGYFLWEGRWYQIRLGIPGSGDPFDMELRRTGGKLGYESMPSYWWREDEEGNTIEADLMRDVYVLVEEIGPGQVFSFTCEMVETRGGIWDEKVYRVSVTAQGEEEPFQVFEVESARGNEFSYWDYDNAFYFVDFNSDGYQDLQTLYYYGANGGTVSTYIWSPSREEFVQAPEELGNEDYRCFPENRRLQIHYRDGGSCGTDELYQWSGEMDYELLRCREYAYEDVFDASDPLTLVGEHYYCRIVSFKGGRERVLADFTYDSEEEMSDYVSFLYWLDVAWERQVALEGLEASCTLRYLQDVSEEDGASAFLDCLLLSREDTCLVGALLQEAPSAYEDFAWDEKNSRLTVSYQDGTMRCYQWNGTAFVVTE